MNKNTPDQVQTLKGFNDWFAPDVRIRERVITTLKKGFEKYGYEPLETPALEYSKFMLGQSGTEAEKQYYRFPDPGGRDVMLKYEVMISMCRAVASNLNQITFPYKRYQIQPVWRAENTQKGRLRQFTQADADTIGSPCLIVDAEFIQMGLEITAGFGFKKFIARISNRKFLEGLSDYLGISENKFYGFCMSIDKLTKIGSEKVEKELIDQRQIEPQQAKKALRMINPEQFSRSTNDQLVASFADTVGKTNKGRQALDELQQIFGYLKLVKVDPKLYRFDPSIARGLASYTGPVWEFEVIDGGVGSICGAGRFDNAIGKYLGKGKQIPATGGSFGVERICQILKDRQMVNINTGPAQVLVTIFSSSLTDNSIKIANQLRTKNINTSLYPITNDKLNKQLKYAAVKNIPWIIIIGPDEAKTDQLVLKNLSTGRQQTTSLTEAIKTISAHDQD